MIDYIENYRKYEKKIVQYLKDRKEFYVKSKCRKYLLDHIKRLDQSWNMEVPGPMGNTYMSQMNYNLVKEIMINKRALFTGNFRPDPLYTLSAIGNTPDENAMNMQDLLTANNKQTKFRSKFLRPALNGIVRNGASIAFTEYEEVSKYGWKTVSDPIQISRREWKELRKGDYARVSYVSVENYGQNPEIIDSEDSDFNYHLERWSLSDLEARQQKDKEIKEAGGQPLYIKQNLEKVIKQVKKEQFVKDPDYVDKKGRDSAKDYGMVKLSDVTRGRAQIMLEGNSDDETYYYYEMIGDIIIRFQDNPYDMDMSQWDVLTCEQRTEYFWGDSPGAYAIQNENSLNLLLGMSLENAIESMKRHKYYNKNAIDPQMMRNLPFNADIPVDVGLDVSLSNIFYTSQHQDTAGSEISQAYARILENNQRTTTTPDLNRTASQGGPANKTAYAAGLMESVGASEDGDLLEQVSTCLESVGGKEVIVLGQFVANFSPVTVRPGDVNSIRELHKQNIEGDFGVTIDTAYKRTHLGDRNESMNNLSWLLNIEQALNGLGTSLGVKFQPLARSIMKNQPSVDIDEVMPETEEGLQPNIPQQPGQPQLAPPQQAPVQIPGGIPQ